MAKTKMQICEYCATQNLAGVRHCAACGAPITASATPASTRQHSPPRPAPKQNAAQVWPSEANLTQIGEKADEAYFTVMSVYAIAWRTVGEAIAIAVAAFIIGTAGGAAGMGFLGVLGAIGLGIAVGVTRKNIYFTLASAPLGTILGLLIGGVFWVMGSPFLLIFLTTGCGIAAAMIGGQPKTAFKRRNGWEKARPFLGALGGLGFGLIGLVLGLGLSGLSNLLR